MIGLTSVPSHLAEKSLSEVDSAEGFQFRKEKTFKPSSLSSSRSHSFNLEDDISMSSSPQIPPFLTSFLGTEKQTAIANSGEESSIKTMNDVQGLTGTGQILQRLHHTKDLEEQILLLQRLATLETLEYQTDFLHPDGRKATVKELINEVYEKASTFLLSLSI